jgi:hypothetical protein
VNKYGNRKTVVDGITFASKAEARRYLELMMLQRGGAISQLELQPRFPMVVNGVKVCTYVADFSYSENGLGTVITVEDVKSEATCKLPVFRIKKKLMLALYGIDVQEVNQDG